MSRGSFFLPEIGNGGDSHSGTSVLRAAEAVRVAIEELPSEFLRGAYLQVDEDRYDDQGIRCLYESMDYPFVRSVAWR